MSNEELLKQCHDLLDKLASIGGYETEAALEYAAKELEEIREFYQSRRDWRKAKTDES